MAEATASAARTDFTERIGHIAAAIGGRSLDADLETWLNANYAVKSEEFRAIADLVATGARDGWLCQHEAQGVRYGRVVKPGQAAGGFSVDVVEMRDVKGPHHVHTTGEIGMIMPISGTPTFDGKGPGWYVYPPGTDHFPTVAGGAAYILYLLPKGAIEFTGRTA